MIQRGAMIWQKFYGAPRVSGADQRISRRDKGCPRKASSEKPSINRWIREQGVKVGDRARRLLGNGSSSQDVSNPGLWTDKHDKEMNFIKEKFGMKGLVHLSLKVRVRA